MGFAENLKGNSPTAKTCQSGFSSFLTAPAAGMVIYLWKGRFLEKKGHV